jgi:hypothetical protein
VQEELDSRDGSCKVPDVKGGDEGEGGGGEAAEPVAEPGAQDDGNDDEEAGVQLRPAAAQAMAAQVAANRAGLPPGVEALLRDGLVVGNIALAPGVAQNFEANLGKDVRWLDAIGRWRDRRYNPGGFAATHGGGKGPVTALLSRADVEKLTAIKAVVDTVCAAVEEELADLQLIVNEDGACQTLHPDSPSDKWRIVANFALADVNDEPAIRWVQVTYGTGKKTVVVWEAVQENLSVYGMSPGVRCSDADGTVVLRHTGTDRQRGRTMSLVMTIRVRPRCAPTSAVPARPSRVSGAFLAAWQDLRPRDVRQARARLRRRA